MRPSLPTLRTWSTDRLAREADALRRSAEHLEGIARDVMTSVDALAPGWTGAAADSARESVAAERATILRTADCWTGAAQALTSSARQIGDLRARVLRLVDAAAGEGLRVDHAGQVSAGGPGADLLGWVRRLAVAQLYGHQIGSMLTAVDQADLEAAAALALVGGDDVDVATLLAAAPVGLDEPDLTEPGPDGFRVGAPDRPMITWDEDYVWDSESPTAGDWTAAASWKTKMAGARVVRRDLTDALDAYAHYWSNSGDTLQIDYERAYVQDSGVQANVDEEIARAAAGADRIASAGASSFAMTGAATPSSSYPVTENWQKTVGGYQQWSSADVAVSSGTVTMTVTVHAEDYYNFNRGQADIASGAPDDENGRFTEVGWAKPFPSTGTVTRTVTWPIGDPASAATSAPETEDAR